MLNKILPDKGLICTAEVKGSYYEHEFFDTIAEAEKYMLKRDAIGRTMFVAQASFSSDKNRKKPNVAWVRSFWLDIDCGTGKPYADQRAGAEALKKFCADTNLPVPSVVLSGYGLYAHWCLTESVSPTEWTPMARVLKALTVAHDLEADPAPTANSVAVLRPVGSHNKKVKCSLCKAAIKTVNTPCHADGCTGTGEMNEILVRKILDSPPVSFDDFSNLLEIAGGKKKISAKEIDPPKPNNDINADAQIYDDTPTASALLIADKCQQIDIMRQTLGDIEEPIWYASIGALRHTIEAPDIIHEWSKGHPDYTAQATDDKIKQHERSGAGPTTCYHFGQVNPRGCLGCPHKNKITSPIQLGRIVEAIEDALGVEPPKPFVRADDGLYCPVDDINTRFYPNDLYVEDVCYDHSLGYEVLVIKHQLPQDGWQECMIRTSALTDVRSAMMALYDNHVTVPGQKEKKLMAQYIEGYAAKLKRERNIKQLLCQMGWYQPEDKPLQFILGQQAYLQDGTVGPVSLAKNIPKSAEAFRSKGDLTYWVDTTKTFGEKGMEPLAFAFLATAFGAPLLRFTGFAGAIVSMLGPSGVGKTLVGHWALSMYGDPDKLVMHADDTRNALIGRLGVYNTLPLYIDEVTNSTPEALSELAYRITQGRDKARQDRNAVEKSNINSWNTLALVSSNSSLVDKLSTHKMDASAEINRVFEFAIEANDALDRQTATKIYRTIHANFGAAGKEYVRYLTVHADKHQASIDSIVAMIDKRTGAQSEERFWSAVAGCAIYGGIIAKKLGLIEFDVGKVSTWVVDTIKDMQTTKKAVAVDAVSIVGQYLDEYAGNTLVVGKNGQVSEPRGALFNRVETESQFVYISRQKIKNHITKKHGCYNTVKKRLEEAGALVDSGKKKVLGAGTSWAGVQDYCWVLDLRCPALGVVAARAADEGVRRVAELHAVEGLQQ